MPVMSYYEVNARAPTIERSNVLEVINSSELLSYRINHDDFMGVDEYRFVVSESERMNKLVCSLIQRKYFMSQKPVLKRDIA